MAASLEHRDVAPLLRGRFGRTYLYVPECASTQRLLGPGAPEGAVAVADHQTGGRGRLGRSWADAPGTALLLSLLLRPRLRAERLPGLTLAAAAACRESIEAVTGLCATVKEPNDILVGERKVAGVLGEAADERVVLGIGINVNQTAEQIPLETRLPATSLRIALGHSVDRAALLAELLARLERRYDEWLSEASVPAG